MAKTVKVEGRVISVPDDATPDEIDQIANPTSQSVSPPVKKELSEGDQSMTPGGVARAMLRQAKEHFTSTGSEIGQGARELFSPGFDPKVGGLSKIVRGTASMAAPALIPAAIATNPLGTAAGIVLGTAGQKAGEAGASLLGAGPGVSSAVGDVGSLAGGFTGFRGSPRNVPFEAIPSAIRGMGEAASSQVRPLLSKLSLFHPFKIAPDIMDAINNVKKGAEVGVERWRARDYPYREVPSEVKTPEAPISYGARNFASKGSVVKNRGSAPEGTDIPLEPRIVKPVPARSPMWKDIVPPGGLEPESAISATNAQGMPVASVETRAVQPPPVSPVESSVKPVLPPSGLKINGGETPSATEIIKPGTAPPGEKLLETEPDQWTWDAIKEKFGQDRVDSIKNKYKDISQRLKSSGMDLEDFMKLPQETKDQIVQVQRHPANPKRPKYSSGFNPKYENLFRELHGEE